MAKVLFIMKYPLEDAYSVKNKFNGQIAAVDDMGHDAYYVAYDKKHTYLIHQGEKTVIKDIWFGNWKMYIHTKAFTDLFDSVCRVLKTIHIDVAYIRSCPLSYNGYRMFRALKKNDVKIVVEIPTYPGSREKQPTFLRRLYTRYSSFWWDRVHPMLTMYTLIGEKADSIGSVPAININNGTNVQLLPLRQPCFEKGKIHLLALAAMSDWQGYDRIIEGIAQLDDNQKNRVILHMVGGEGNGALAKWTVLSRKLGLENQVIFHGEMNGAELDDFFNQSDVGIGSLGLYRKGFQTSSILKLREYCSRGLPFVYAAEDPAIDTSQPFCMQVSNDDSIIDVAAIMDFAEKMRNESDLPAVMRQYARENMSWEVQFKKVFDALEKMGSNQEA